MLCFFKQNILQTAQSKKETLTKKKKHEQKAKNVTFKKQTNLQSLDANWGQYEREIWVQEILKLKKRETNEEKKFPGKKYNGSEHRAGNTA